MTFNEPEHRRPRKMRSFLEARRRAAPHLRESLRKPAVVHAWGEMGLRKVHGRHQSQRDGSHGLRSRPSPRSETTELRSGQRKPFRGGPARSLYSFTAKSEPHERPPTSSAARLRPALRGPSSRPSIQRHRARCNRTPRRARTVRSGYESISLGALSWTDAGGEVGSTRRTFRASAQIQRAPSYGALPLAVNAATRHFGAFENTHSSNYLLPHRPSHRPTCGPRSRAARPNGRCLLPHDGSRRSST